MKNLKQLLGICEHKWVIERKVDVYLYDNGIRIMDVPAYMKYELRCEKCGRIKKKKV